MVLIFRYIKREKNMAANKDNGGFLSGVGQLLGMLLMFLVVYETIKWIFTSSIKEKIILVLGLGLMVLYILWGQSLM
jgi:hypothetical protein